MELGSGPPSWSRGLRFPVGALAWRLWVIAVLPAATHRISVLAPCPRPLVESSTPVAAAAKRAGCLAGCPSQWHHVRPALPTPILLAGS